MCRPAHVPHLCRVVTQHRRCPQCSTPLVERQAGQPGIHSVHHEQAHTRHTRAHGDSCVRHTRTNTLPPLCLAAGTCSHGRDDRSTALSTCMHVLHKANHSWLLRACSSKALAHSPADVADHNNVVGCARDKRSKRPCCSRNIARHCIGEQVTHVGASQAPSTFRCGKC